MSKAFPFVIQLILLALVTFGLHFLYHSLADKLTLWEMAPMQLWQIYGLQLLLSIILIFGIIGISNSMPQNLGFVFLGFFTLKVIINYIVIRPVLKAGESFDFFKYSFLIVFFMFMAFDVYVTYRVLNQSYSVKNN